MWWNVLTMMLECLRLEFYWGDGRVDLVVEWVAGRWNSSLRKIVLSAPEPLLSHTHTCYNHFNGLTHWSMIIVSMCSAYCRSQGIAILLHVLCWLFIRHATLCYYIASLHLIISKCFIKHSLFYVFFFFFSEC